MTALGRWRQEDQESKKILSKSEGKQTSDLQEEDAKTEELATHCTGFLHTLHVDHLEAIHKGFEGLGRCRSRGPVQFQHSWWVAQPL